MFLPRDVGHLSNSKSVVQKHHTFHRVPSSPSQSLCNTTSRNTRVVRFRSLCRDKTVFPITTEAQVFTKSMLIMITGSLLQTQVGLRTENTETTSMEELHGAWTITLTTQVNGAANSMSPFQYSITHNYCSLHLCLPQKTWQGNNQLSTEETDRHPGKDKRWGICPLSLLC